MDGFSEAGLLTVGADNFGFSVAEPQKELPIIMMRAKPLQPEQRWESSLITILMAMKIQVRMF